MLVHSALTDKIIGLAMRVHRTLGPGLLESLYETCLCFELAQAGIPIRRQVPIAVTWRGMRIPGGYRADVIVDDIVLVEIKAVERLLPVHVAQTLTYLRLSECEVALLLNFNEIRLKDGLKRFVRSHGIPVEDAFTA